MKSFTIEKAAFIHEEPLQATSRSFWSTVLLLTALGSVACLVAGLLISLLTWVDLIPPTPYTAYLTVALLIGSFVLIFFAAHSMDRAAAADKAERIEFCERQIEKLFHNSSR